MSKQPILQSKCVYFTNMKNEERLTSKGALLVTFDGPRSLLLTHPQSWDKYKHARFDQFASLLTWVESVKNPIIIVGDLNVDFHKLGKFKSFVAQLPTLLGSEMYSQTKFNSLRGNDTSAAKNGCGMEYYCNVCYSSKHEHGICKLACDKPKDEAFKTFCPCCPDQLLDFGFIPKQHVNAKTLTMRVLPWKSDEFMVFPTWIIGQVTMPQIRTRDLSDHYPVALDWEC